MSSGTEYPFGQPGSAVLAMSPPTSCPHPAYWPFGEGAGETVLLLHKHCPAKPKTFMCYQHPSSYNYKEQAGGLIWWNLTSPQVDPIQCCYHPPRIHPQQPLSRNSPEPHLSPWAPWGTIWRGKDDTEACAGMQQNFNESKEEMRSL